MRVHRISLEGICRLSCNVCVKKLRAVATRTHVLSQKEYRIVSAPERRQRPSVVGIRNSSPASNANVCEGFSCLLHCMSIILNSDMEV